MKNKRSFKQIAGFFLLACLCLPWLTVSVYAEEPPPSGDTDMSVIWENIPEDVRDLLPEELKTDDVYSAASALQTKTGVRFFLQMALDALTGHLRKSASNFAVIAGLIVLSAAFSAFKHMTTSGAVVRIFELCSGVCITLALFGTQREIMEAAVAYLERLTLLVNGMNTVMGAIYLTSGNFTTAALSNGMLMLFLSILQNLSSGGIMPLMQICFGFTLVSAVSGTINLGGISKLIRGIYTFIVMLMMMVFGFVLTYQSTLAQSADTFAARTVKFAVGSFVPIVGSALSDAVQTASASLSLLKSTAGTIGIVLVLILLVPMIISLMVNKLALAASSVLADVLGCSRESALIGEMNSLCSFALAMVAFSSVVFLFCLTLFSRSPVALGG